MFAGVFMCLRDTAKDRPPSAYPSMYANQSPSGAGTPPPPRVGDAARPVGDFEDYVVSPSEDLVAMAAASRQDADLSIVRQTLEGCRADVRRELLQLVRQPGMTRVALQEHGHHAGCNGHHGRDCVGVTQGGATFWLLGVHMDSGNNWLSTSNWIRTNTIIQCTRCQGSTYEFARRLF